MLMVLIIVAGVVSIITGTIQHGKEGAVDGSGILVAVLIVVFVGGFNKYQKAKTICSNKTATLATNKMGVAKCHLYGIGSYFAKLPIKMDM